MREPNGYIDDGLQTGNDGSKRMAELEGVENALKNRCWREI